MTTEFAIIHLQKAYALLIVGGDLSEAEKIKSVIIGLEKRYTIKNKEN
jgi:hypothetical protein